MESTNEEKQYALFLHLSQLGGMLIPLLGLVLPIILWAVKKDQSPYIDAQGKIVFNWIISCLLYEIIIGVLCLFLVGFALLIPFLICNLIFIIIGAIKASQGELWPYPLSINFIN